MAPAHPHATRVAVYPALLDIAGGTDYTSSEATPFKVLTILAEWEPSFDYVLMALQLGLMESDAFCSTSLLSFRTFLFMIIFLNLSFPAAQSAAQQRIPPSYPDFERNWNIELLNEKQC